MCWQNIQCVVPILAKFEQSMTICDRLMTELGISQSPMSMTYHVSCLSDVRLTHTLSAVLTEYWICAHLIVHSSVICSLSLRLVVLKKIGLVALVTPFEYDNVNINDKND